MIRYANRKLFGFILALSLNRVTPAIGQTTGGSQPDFLTAPSKIPRLALVIGAEQYHEDRGVDPVPNALNDARRMQAVLQQAGFSYVRLLPNPDNVSEIQDFINDLVNQAGRPEDPVVLVFFFAGHGFQNDAFNYIVPTGARADHAIEDSFPVINIVSALAAHRNSLAILLFDSCRTGVAQAESSLASSKISTVGFAPLPLVYGADLGLAAAYGKPAKSRAHDGDPDSPYTSALSEYISRDSLSLNWVFSKVAMSVKELNIDQVPFEVKGAVDEGFFFNPKQPEIEGERVMWQSVLQTDSPSCVQAFIDSHPGGDYLKSAIAWLAEGLHPEPTRSIQCPAN